METTNGIELLRNAIANIITKNPQPKILKLSEEDREKLHFDLMLSLAKTDPIAFALYHENIREYLFHYMHLVSFDDGDEE